MDTKGLMRRLSLVQKKPAGKWKGKACDNNKLARKGSRRGFGFKMRNSKGICIRIGRVGDWTSRSSPPDSRFWAVNQTGQAFQLRAS